MSNAPPENINIIDFDENKIYKIIFEIKNMNTLTKEQLESIESMSSEDKMKIIYTFNTMFKYINEFIENK